MELGDDPGEIGPVPASVDSSVRCPDKSETGNKNERLGLVICLKFDLYRSSRSLLGQSREVLPRIRRFLQANRRIEEFSIK